MHADPVCRDQDRGASICDNAPLKRDEVGCRTAVGASSLLECASVPFPKCLYYCGRLGRVIVYAGDRPPTIRGRRILKQIAIQDTSLPHLIKRTIAAVRIVIAGTGSCPVSWCRLGAPA